MALYWQSLDEDINDLVNAYDEEIAPKKVWRSNNNKLYLILKSVGKGINKLRDVVIGLKNRFDPLYCDESDLESTMRIAGVKRKEGMGSVLRVFITNSSDTTQATLKSGVYTYTSSSGMPFLFEITNDYVFDPAEVKLIPAVSRDKGSYRVEAQAKITVQRFDLAPINDMLKFSCEDNLSYIGYPDEDDISLRNRLITDTERQDHIRELESKIRGLPGIFECSLAFNEKMQPVEYEGMTLAAKELLIVITGVPTSDIARLVAEEVQYTTHQVSPEMVVYYEHETYLGGKYPVYYMFHNTFDFNLEVVYKYNSQQVKPVQVEDAVWQLLDKYAHAVSFISVISEKVVYEALSGLSLPSAAILDVNLIVGGEPVSHSDIPRTRLPHLADIVFTSIDTVERI